MHRNADCAPDATASGAMSLAQRCAGTATTTRGYARRGAGLQSSTWLSGSGGGATGSAQMSRHMWYITPNMTTYISMIMPR